MDDKRRHGIQAIATLIQNCHIKGFFTGEIYKGSAKNVCVPGINCYSCPGAVASCPIGALQNALSSRNFKFPYYVIGLLIFFGALMGRLICGFLCPFGFIQDLLNLIPFPKKVRTFKYDFLLRKFRWVMLVFFVIILPVLVKMTPAFCKYICPSGTIAGILLSFNNHELFDMYGLLFLWKLWVLTGVVIASMVILRPFCKYFCPVGLIYGFFNKISVFRMNHNSEACINCGKCEAVCGMGVKPDETPNHSECIRCMRCIHACPNAALSYSFRKQE